MAAPLSGTVYFQVDFVGIKDLPARRAFLKAAVDEDIGTAISRILPREDLMVQSITAGKSELLAYKEPIYVEAATPVNVLHEFGTRFLSVQLMEHEVPNTKQNAGEKNVFDILLRAQKSYNLIPKERQEINSKDRLYNMVLKFMQKNGVAFTPMQVETTGTYICKTLTNTLWYLDPHWEKFEQRSISCVDFQDLRGYNNWRKLKIKEPKVTSEDLTEHISNMITMTSAGYFLNQKFKHFKGMCENLIQGMVKYKKHIDQQAQRSAVNREKTEPVRSLNDHNVLRDLKIGTDIDRNYTLVHESLRTLKEFEPLFLFDYEPEDVYDRKLWLEKMTFPYPVKMYTHKFGNFLGNHTFIWKSPEDTKDLSRATGDLDAITAVKHDLEKFSTRAMRRNFFQKYSKTGAKPAILRSIYRYLTEDDTAPESNEQRAIDTRVSEFLLQSDSTELLYDLRRNNGRPKDKDLDPFWDALGKHLDSIAVVHERRHKEHMYMPIEMSIDSLIETVKKDLPQGIKVPSPSWLAFNFWPSNKFVRNAMSYTGRYEVRYAVQQRLTRARHPDSGFAFTQFVLMKELAVRFRNESILICLDDKSVVPVGEPGKPVSTGVRAHNKSLVIRGAVLSALDHDFHIHGAVPSVLFKVDIPEHKSDSFYNGTVHVTVKEKVFSPSSPMRHAAESMKILRNGDSEDGLSLTKPILFVYTDGGPDQRSTYWSVQLSYICMFIALDLDMLIAVRTAPSQSYNNPAERCMSLLNIALQNVALHRESMTENLELRVRSLTSLGKIRNAANRDPDLKTSLVDSMEPVLAVLKQRFSKLKFHQEPLLVHDAATDEEIEQSSRDVLQIFSDDPDTPVSCKTYQQSSERLKKFFDTHCRKRHYSFQIRKCKRSVDDCWFCALFPKRLDQDLEWLPDPTTGPDGEFLLLSDCIGTETTDDKRPSLDGKIAISENDKKNKSHLNAAQVRGFIICQECGKRRAIYCKRKLSHIESTRVDDVKESMSYSCGSNLFFEEDPLFSVIFVRESLSCRSEIETSYYSAVSHKFAPICIHCGSTDILGNEEEPIISLKKNYSIVRPICKDCITAGKTPITRNQLKVNAKKK